MKAIKFGVGLIVGAIFGFIGGIGILIYFQERNKDTGEMSIVFARKNYYDSDQMVAISGTLTGPGMAYPNNTYSFGCYQDRKECWMTYVEAIGAQQIGRMDAPSAYDIRSWTKNEIVAAYDGTFGCYKTTITISRATEQLLWVDEPVNQTKPFCKNAENKIRKFSIEDPPGSKRLFGQSK
ncbi:MAG TPA: hypothetical protein VFB02_24460 [Bradyrhizobium sp.]|nr:hypothetical protein [Bradyrhizobium sp.]